MESLIARTTVAIGDINNDGRNDVVVGNSGLNIEVFLQNSNGGLNPSVKYPTVDSDKIKIGDFNNDGLLDVVGIGCYVKWRIYDEFCIQINPNQ